MRKVAVLALVLAAASLSLSIGEALAAKNDVYTQKKAECKQEARAKHFGIHWMKRDQWVKNCIAGRHT